MDDINLNPQSDDQAGDQQPDNQKNPSDEVSNTESSFDLNKSEEAGKSADMDTSLMSDQGNPAQIETPSAAPAPEESKIELSEEESTESESANAEQTEAETGEEVAAGPAETEGMVDEAVSSYESSNVVPEEKKGLPKAVLIGLGVLIVGTVVGATMFITDSWPFKGQVTEVIQGPASGLRTAADVPEYCPVDEYYDENAQSETATSRLVNSIPRAKAQTSPDGNDAYYNRTIVGNEAEELVTEIAPRNDNLLIVGNEAEELTTVVGNEAEELVTEIAPTDNNLRIVGNEAEELATELAPSNRTLDTSKCMPIPQDNCDLLETLKLNPEQYFLDPETLKHVEEWSAQCQELSEVPIQLARCSDNQELNDSGDCICSAGYFEIAATASEEALSDNINSLINTSALECSNCEDLSSQITELTERIAKIQALDSTTDAQIDRLEKVKDRYELALQDNCVESEEVLEEYDYINREETLENLLPTPEIDTIERVIPTVELNEVDCGEHLSRINELQDSRTTEASPEVSTELARLISEAEEAGCEMPEESTCDKLREASKDAIATGDLRRSYEIQLEMIDNDCLRTYSSCDEHIAKATVSNEYTSTVQEVSEIEYYQGEFDNYANTYYNDRLCIDSLERECIEVEARMSGVGINDNINATLLDQPEAISDNLLANTDELNLIDLNLRQNTLDDMINLNIANSQILEDQDFYNEYCIETVPYSGSAVIEPPPGGEEPPPPVSPAMPPPAEEPPPVSPPVEEASTSDTAVAEIISVDETTIDSDTATFPPVLPDETETDLVAASISDPEMSATTSEEGTVVTDTNSFHPGATEQPDEVDITEAPTITETGPEMFIYFFMIVASQVFIFRRRIYEFVENRG